MVVTGKDTVRVEPGDPQEAVLLASELAGTEVPNLRTDVERLL